ncbi:aspartyl-tRNA amidotransferase subunit B [Deltaproteobacteria bacterium]|nr:aspartyl-tRNA amidotransferase subunit B [Deltaproteobacteria bacterium]
MCAAAMSLSEQIEKEYVQAYKAKDSVRLSVLRLVKTAVKNRLVELRRPGGALSDDEMLDVVLKEAKQRQDSIEQYTAAKRAELADRESAELAILKKYLPQPLNREAIDSLVETAIAELQAVSPKDTGRVMSAIMALYKGRVDGKTLAEAVKARLA